MEKFFITLISVNIIKLIITNGETNSLGLSLVTGKPYLPDEIFAGTLEGAPERLSAWVGSY
jgi:hypothetical protein